MAPSDETTALKHALVLLERTCSELQAERDEARAEYREEADEVARISLAAEEIRKERDTLKALLREVQACDVIYGQRDTWTVVLPDRLCQAIRTALEGHDAK